MADLAAFLAGAFLAGAFFAGAFLAAAFFVPAFFAVDLRPGRDGTARLAAARARSAVWPADLRAADAVLPAVLRAAVAVLPAVLLAALAVFSADLDAALAVFSARCVASLVALRPASADFFSTSATWLARLSMCLPSTRFNWVATSWRTISMICSLVLRLRSTKLSTHSCACSRWISPAFTNSRTISSARPRVTWPNTEPASRYLRIRSLLAIAQEYPKC